MCDNRLYVAYTYTSFVTCPSARTQKWVEVSESDGDGSSVPGGHSRVAAKAMFIVELTKAKPDWSSLPESAQQRLPAQSQPEAGGSAEGADKTTGDATVAGPQVAVSRGGVLCGYYSGHVEAAAAVTSTDDS